MRIRKVVLVAFLLCLYIGPVVFMSSYASPTILTEPNMSKEFQISAEPWITGWTYRREVNIAYQGSNTDANHPIFVNVSYNTHMQTDFDDIRFTDNDKTTLLDYWLEVKSDSSYASFWVAVLDAITANMSFYMYYGNSTVSSASSGTDTFLFFDDFELNNMSRWYDAGAYWSTVSDRVKYGSYAGFGDAGAVLDGRYLSQKIYWPYHSQDFLVHMFVQTQIVASKQILCRSYNTSAGTLEALNMDNSYFFYDNGPYNQWSATTYSADTWYELEIALDFTNSLYRFWRDGALIGSQDLEGTSGYPIVTVESWDFIVDSTAGNDMWLDDCYIRKWVDNEPIFDSFGAEQDVTYVIQWREVNEVTLIFWVDFDYWAMDVSLILLGLFLVVISSCWLAYKIRTGSLNKDSGYLFLVIFMLAWGLVLGGAIL